MKLIVVALALGTAGLTTLLAAGQGAPSAQSAPPDAAALMEQSQRAFYYGGDDSLARVTMELIDRSGARRTRELTMARLNIDAGGDQKYFIYFHEPADVRRMTFMVWKYPDRNDDRWIFVPAVDLIRRIAADDSRSSFVGSDFTYEDISGRDISADRHTLLRQETLGGRECYVIESVPTTRTDYARRVSWLDARTLLPVQEEYYDAQGDQFRVFTADRIENVPVESDPQKAVATVMERTMRNLKTGHGTEVRFTSVAYNLGLNDEDFSERRMRRPPREWTQ